MSVVIAKVGVDFNVHRQLGQFAHSHAGHRCDCQPGVPHVSCECIGCVERAMAGLKVGQVRERGQTNESEHMDGLVISHPFIRSRDQNDRLTKWHPKDNRCGSMTTMSTQTHASTLIYSGSYSRNRRTDYS